jgi:opacity protein-like surface antigen
MKTALICAAVIAAVSASPALAQAVISDPGYCAQFYPNANCQNLGAGNPYTNGGYWGNGWQNSKGWQNSYGSLDHHWYHHSRHHG